MSIPFNNVTLFDDAESGTFNPKGLYWYDIIEDEDNEGIIELFISRDSLEQVWDTSYTYIEAKEAEEDIETLIEKYNINIHAEIPKPDQQSGS